VRFVSSLLSKLSAPNSLLPYSNPLPVLILTFDDCLFSACIFSSLLKHFLPEFCCFILGGLVGHGEQQQDYQLQVLQLKHEQKLQEQHQEFLKQQQEQHQEFLKQQQARELKQQDQQQAREQKQEEQQQKHQKDVLKLQQRQQSGEVMFDNTYA